jgi:peptidoglycan/LPS O-acetylase OafA/YrhL
MDNGWCVRLAWQYLCVVFVPSYLVELTGYGFEDHPMLGALLLNPTDTTLGGILAGWLYLRTRSVWTSTVAHASWNVSAACFGGALAASTTLHQWWLGAAAQAVVAALCIVSVRRQPRQLVIFPDERASA